MTTRGASPVVVSVLGPTAVTSADGRIEVGKRKVRSLLAALALHAPSAVRAERIVEILWPDPSKRPASPDATVHTYVANLRAALRAVPGATALIATDDGYRITDASVLDVTMFRADVQRARDAHAQGRATAAAEALELALARWHGAAFADILDDPDAASVSRTLDGERIGAIELHAEIALELGEADTLVSALEAAVVQEPFRERLWQLLVVAQYRCGRQADALATCGRARALLRDELGLEPGPELRSTERAVLEQEQWLERPRASTTPAPPVPLAPGVSALDDKPFVGRDEAMAALRGWWDSPSAIAIVEGEGGIGKSRVCARVATDLHARGVDVVWGACTEITIVPFQPVFDTLAEIAAADGFARLRDRVGHEGIAALEALLGGTPRELSNLPALNSDSARALLFRAAGAAFHRDVRDRPLLVVIDDLHLADPASVVMLDVVTRAVGPQTRWLVNHRPGEARASSVVALLDRWAAEGATTVSLGGLGRDAIAALASDLGVTAGASVADDLERATNGNALFVTTLLQDLHDGVDASSRSTAAAVHRRLANLDARTQDVLRTASICGTTFAPAVLIAANGAPERDTEAALDVALGAGIIELCTDGRSCRFAHDVVRDAIATTMSALRAAREHRRVALALEAVHADHLDDVAAELAHHWVVASADGDCRGAIEWGERAARHALAQYAHEEALRILRLVLDAIGPDGHDAARVELLLLVGEASWRLGDVDGARRIGAVAYDIAVRVGSPQQVVVALMLQYQFESDQLELEPLVRLAIERIDANDHATEAVAKSLLAQCLSDTRPDDAVVVMDEALAAAERSGEPLAECIVLGDWLWVRWVESTVPERQAMSARLTRIGRASGAIDQELLGHSWQLATALEGGDIESAFAELDEHARLARRLGMPRYLAGMHQKQGMFALFEGRFADAQRLADAAIAQMPTEEEFFAGWAAQLFALHIELGRWEALDALADAVRTTDPAGRFRAALVLLDAALGRVQEAERGFDDLTLDGTLDRRDPLHLATLGQLADAAWRLRDPDRGRLVLSVFEKIPLRVIVIGGGVVCWGSTARFIAPLQLLCGDAAAAVEWYAQSLAAHEHMGGRPFVARDRVGLARALAAHDPEHPRPRQLAAAGVRLARHLAMEEVEREGAALLAELDALAVS